MHRFHPLQPAPRSLRIRHAGVRAFSLVEVVLSLGIISFSLVGIMGLLFSGLTTFHRSIDQTVQVQIAQQVISDAQLSTYNNLQPFTTNYDEYGNGVAAGDSRAVYQVNFMLTNLATSLTTNFSSAVGTNVVIYVSSKTSPGVTNVYSSVLSRNNN